MKIRKVILGIVAAILVIAGLALGGLALAGRLPEQGGNLYDLDLGVVVMSSVNGSQVEKIAEALVSAWSHEK